MKGIWICGLSYGLLFYANDWLTQYLEAAPGVNWVYLPAGLRMFLVLIFGLSGAIGITFSSTLITLLRGLGDDPITIAGVGLISGFSPYIARFLVIRNLKIAPDLSNLNLQSILISILIFSILSVTLHQFWFGLRDISDIAFSNLAAMLIGDILGSILLISLLKVGIDLFKKIRQRNSLL